MNFLNVCDKQKYSDTDSFPLPEVSSPAAIAPSASLN